MAARMRTPAGRGPTPRPSHAPGAPAPVGPGQWFATAAPGLEEVVAAEVAQLPGAAEVVQVAGGVEFSGDLALGMRANRSLRVATRVLRRLGVIESREFSKLERQAAKLDWPSYIDGAQPLRFEVSARSSRLYHTKAVAESLASAIAACTGHPVTFAPAHEPGSDETEAGEAGDVLRIFARGERDRWTISVDSSGALLHRRGWRIEAGPAPLRETLAAGLLRLAGYDPAQPLVDPMCGSGTIVIEAAAIARGLAPGAGRRFALERWPAFAQLPRPRPDDARPGGAAAPIGAGPAPIWGFDADPAVLAVAARNAARAGVADQIGFAPAALGPRAQVLGLPAGPGLVVVNPPYGRRLGQRGAAAHLVRVIGQDLRRRFPGWRAGILLADPAWARGLGLPVVASWPLHNGGLRVSYVMVAVPRA